MVEARDCRGWSKTIEYLGCATPFRIFFAFLFPTGRKAAGLARLSGQRPRLFFFCPSDGSDGDDNNSNNNTLMELHFFALPDEEGTQKQEPKAGIRDCWTRRARGVGDDRVARVRLVQAQSGEKKHMAQDAVNIFSMRTRARRGLAVKERKRNPHRPSFSKKKKTRRVKISTQKTL